MYTANLQWQGWRDGDKLTKEIIGEEELRSLHQIKINYTQLYAIIPMIRNYTHDTQLYPIIPNYNNYTHLYPIIPKHTKLYPVIHNTQLHLIIPIIPIYPLLCPVVSPIIPKYTQSYPIIPIIPNRTTYTQLYSVHWQNFNLLSLCGVF